MVTIIYIDRWARRIVVATDAVNRVPVDKYIRTATSLQESIQLQTAVQCLKRAIATSVVCSRRSFLSPRGSQKENRSHNLLVLTVPRTQSVHWRVVVKPSNGLLGRRGLVMIRRVVTYSGLLLIGDMARRLHRLDTPVVVAGLPGRCANVWDPVGILEDGSGLFQSARCRLGEHEEDVNPRGHEEDAEDDVGAPGDFGERLWHEGAEGGVECPVGTRSLCDWSVTARQRLGFV